MVEKMARPVIGEPQRRDIIFQCTYQIGKMLIALMDAAERGDRHDNITSLIQGMVPRLYQLNGVVMDAADDRESVFSLLERMKGADHM